MTPTPPNKRPMIGVITVACFAGAVISSTTGEWNSATTGAFVRVGMVMAAVWLAYPSLRGHRLSRQFSRGAIVFLVVLAVFINRLRYFLPVIAVLLVVFWFVRPKRRPQ